MVSMNEGGKSDIPKPGIAVPQERVQTGHMSARPSSLDQREGCLAAEVSASLCLEFSFNLNNWEISYINSFLANCDKWDVLQNIPSGTQGLEGRSSSSFRQQVGFLVPCWLELLIHVPTLLLRAFRLL